MNAAGAEVFHCAKRALKLTRMGCARLHQSACQSRPDPWEGRASCLFCVIGAKNRHALLGTGPAVIEPIFAAAEPWRPVCARCRRRSDRIIRKRLCVSCYNRTREAISGKNAKGNRPALSGQLHPIVVCMMSDGGARLLREDMALDMPELLIAAVKVARGPVAFAWGGAHG